jgi:hypothetical protein
VSSSNTTPDWRDWLEPSLVVVTDWEAHDTDRSIPSNAALTDLLEQIARALYGAYERGKTDPASPDGG